MVPYANAWQYVRGRIARAATATGRPPDSIGLKQVYYGTRAGIKNESYGPGLHFVMSGVERTTSPHCARNRR